MCTIHTNQADCREGRWRNGRRSGLKIRRVNTRVGSTPTRPIYAGLIAFRPPHMVVTKGESRWLLPNRHSGLHGF